MLNNFKSGGVACLLKGTFKASLKFGVEGMVFSVQHLRLGGLSRDQVGARVREVRVRSARGPGVLSVGDPLTNRLIVAAAARVGVGVVRFLDPGARLAVVVRALFREAPGGHWLLATGSTDALPTHAFAPRKPGCDVALVGHAHTRPALGEVLSVVDAGCRW